MKKWIITALFLCQAALMGYNCQAQQDAASVPTDNPMRSHLDSLVDSRVQVYFTDKKAVGLSLGLLIGGKQFFYNYGETRAGNGTLPKSDTFYEIGSMTKTFTGILLAQAVLDKKISLDDDIRLYLKGDYPNLQYGNVPVRIADLANHTSRITRIFPNLWERDSYNEANPYSNYTKPLLYAGLRQMKLDTVPGLVYSYSNMAVGLLGAIEEECYQRNYFDLISRYILVPLKMVQTRIDLSGVTDEGIAFPHDASRKTVPFWDVPELPALGAMRSTTSDMVKFIRANNAEKIPAIALSHKRTFGTEQEGMALNWFIHTTPDGFKVIEHSGGTGGSRSSLQCVPGLNAGFIILTNSLANRNELEKELLKIVSAEKKK